MQPPEPKYHATPTGPARRLLALLFAATCWLTTLAGGAQPQPAPASTPEGVAAAPDVRLLYATSLSALAADWPGLGELDGPAEMEILLQTVEREVAQLVVLRSVDARLGPVPLGHLQLQLWTPPGAGRTTATLEIQGPLAQTLRAEFQLELELDLPRGKVRWRGGFFDGELQIAGLRLEQLTAAYPWLALHGSLDLELKASGTPDGPRLDGQVQAADVRFHGEEVGGLAATVQFTDRRGRVALRWGPEAAPLATARLELPLDLRLQPGKLDWLDDRSLNLQLDAPRLTPATLAPLWVAPPGFDFTLGLTLTGQGRLDDLALTGELAGTLRSGEAPERPLRLALQAGPTRQELTFQLGTDELALRLQTAAPLVALRRAGQRAATVPLTGSLGCRLPLPLLVPFLPRGVVDPAGRLAGEVQIGGTLGQPSLDGHLLTEEAALTLLPLNSRLEDLTLKSTLARDTWTIEELSAQVRAGRLQGQGEARLVLTPADLPATARLWSGWRLTSTGSLTLQELPFLQEGLPVGRLDGRLTVATIMQAGETELRVDLAEAEVQLGEQKMTLPATVPTNPAVRLIDWLGQVRPSTSLLAGEGRLHLELALPTPLTVTSEQIALALAGKLVLDRQGTLTAVTGGLELQPGGQFTLFDNPFVIRSGSFTLLGGDLAATPALELEEGESPATALHDPDAEPKARPLEAVLDVLAEGRAVETRVGVEVRGPLRQPELLLASDPALPEYQILTLLITGRVDAVDERNGEVRRQVAQLVDRFHNPSLKRQLFDRLGVDNLGLGFGASVSEPILTVGKQINRRLYVETVYHHNAPEGVNSKEGHVEYRLSPSWTVDTVFGDAAQGSAGLYWRHTFGGQPPPRLGDTVALFGSKRRPPDADSDGIPDATDGCPLQAEDRDRFQDDDGCPDPDNDEDGIPDVRDRAPDQAETVNGYRDEDGEPDTVPPKLVWRTGSIRTLGFETNSAALTPEGQAALDAAVLTLRQFSTLQVSLAGHSDDQGPPELNRRVSLRRAQVVEERLRRAGIARGRITVVGHGPDHPLDTSGSEEGRAKNRRVEMTFFEEAVAPP